MISDEFIKALVDKTIIYLKKRDDLKLFFDKDGLLTVPGVLLVCYITGTSIETFCKWICNGKVEGRKDEQ